MSASKNQQPNSRSPSRRNERGSALADKVADFNNFESFWRSGTISLLEDPEPGWNVPAVLLKPLG
jgi:hypothetical protein